MSDFSEAADRVAAFLDHFPAGASSDPNVIHAIGAEDGIVELQAADVAALVEAVRTQRITPVQWPDGAMAEISVDGGQFTALFYFEADKSARGYDGKAKGTEIEPTIRQSMQDVKD